MEFNPYSQQCRDLAAEREQVYRREMQLYAELTAHDAIDIENLLRTRDKLTLQSSEQQKQISALEGTHSELQKQYNELTRRIKTLWNPRNWFDETQRRLRHDRQALEVRIHSNFMELQSKQTRQAQTRTRLNDVSNKIQEYYAFDVEETEDSFNSAVLSREALDSRLSTLSALRDKVDRVLKPTLEQIRCIKEQIRQSEDAIDRAQQFEYDLDAAHNGYERKLIHDECELEFRTGKPGKVISKHKRRLPALRRDLDKLEQRAKDDAQKASRSIDTIVIDGNNMCYENNHFIGLAPLLVLVPELAASYRITLIFDAQITYLLNETKESITQRFQPYNAEVHMVSRGRAADETILDVASEETTYVLSNDKFRDFYDKPAVKAKRILHYEIVSGKILIQDLDIRVTFR